MKKNTKRKRPFHQDVSKWHSNNQFKLLSYDYAIIACDYKQVTKNQMESCRKLISRLVRKTKPRPLYKMLSNYSIALTKKSTGARMGRGKGNIKCYVSKICKNDAIFAFKKCT
jgi:ribosomal protein L16/L10AE